MPFYVDGLEASPDQIALQRALINSLGLTAVELSGDARAEIDQILVRLSQLGQLDAVPRVLLEDKLRRLSNVEYPLIDAAEFNRSQPAVVELQGGRLGKVRADSPRMAFNNLGDYKGMQLEESWEQLIPNVEATGGAPGVLPTGWNTASKSAYATLTVIDRVEEAGMIGLEFEVSAGAITADGALFLNFATNVVANNPIAGVQGETFTSTLYMRLVSGDIMQECIGNIGAGMQEIGTPGSTSYGNNLQQVPKLGLITNELIRTPPYTRTLSNAASTKVMPCWKMEFKTGFGALTPLRFRVFWPNLEKSSKTHTVTNITGVIPAEIFKGTLSYETGEGRLLAQGISAKYAGAQVLGQLDRNNDVDCLRLGRNANGIAELTVINAGVTAATLELGRWGNDMFASFAVDFSPGGLQVSMNGKTPVSYVGKCPSVSHWRRGSNAAGLLNWNGAVDLFELAAEEDELQAGAASKSQVFLHDDFLRADGSIGFAPGKTDPYIVAPQPSSGSQVRPAFILNGRYESPSAASQGTIGIATYTGMDAGAPIRRMAARARWNNTPPGQGGNVTLISLKEGVWNPTPGQGLSDYITGNNGHQGSVHGVFTDILAYVEYFHEGQKVEITKPAYAIPHTEVDYQFGWRHLGNGHFIWELPAPLGSPCKELPIYSPELAEKIGNFFIFEHFFNSTQAMPSIAEIYVET